ncbi:MAG TPA: NAD(P)/FAD-dependent oxidoreductase [Micromonosporaceae bacterium]|nr:NAD(P)/FAD-dependent oxidoreductase [Micromonosporaceae bacterium]
MPSAVVVGAGIGGLAVAGALARRDWAVTILESNARLDADRAGLMLWPSGVEALRRLGLAGGLDAIASPIAARGVCRPDGSWLVRPDEVEVGAGPPVVVRRVDLHDALVAGLGSGIDVRTGVTVRGVRMSATSAPAVSDAATTWEADLVVGADGITSAVRRRLAPEATVVPAGCTAWRAFIPWYRGTALMESLNRPSVGARGGETVGAGHRFRYAVLEHRGSSGASAQGGIYWTATVPGAARPESADAQLALLRRWFADWHAPIGALIAATAPDDVIQHAVGELWPLPRAFAFHAGRGGYALIGDAAHAMSHHLGTGACLALEDAAALVEAVGGGPSAGRALQSGLDRYAHGRRRDVARIGRQSRRIGAALATSRASARERDAVLGVAPGPFGRASQALRSLRRT